MTDTEKSRYKWVGFVRVWTVLVGLLAIFFLVNFVLFMSSPAFDVGVGSQWLYNVRIGDLATFFYEEKVWVDSIVYCEKVLCMKVMKTNPSHVHSDYVTGDNYLIKSTILDKGDGTVYEIVYDPPLLLRPLDPAVGDTWTWNSVAKVRIVMSNSVEEQKVEMPITELKVVDTVVLTGRAGVLNAFLIEERTDGVLTRRMIYSPVLHQAVRYELPVSLVWAELIDVRLAQPGVLDFLRINVFTGVELRYFLILLVFLGFLRVLFGVNFFVDRERKNIVQTG